MEKVHFNFTKLHEWVQHLPKKLSANTAAAKRMIEEQREAAAVLRTQDKESFLEQIEQLVSETNTNANSQASLEQQFKALQEDYQQFRTEQARVVTNFITLSTHSGRLHALLASSAPQFEPQSGRSQRLTHLMTSTSTRNPARPEAVDHHPPLDSTCA